MNVVNKYIPNEVGTFNTGSGGYFGGSNEKAGLIKNFILEIIKNAIVLSDGPQGYDHNPRVINIAITDQFIIEITALVHSTTSPYGSVICTLKGPNVNGPLNAPQFQSGYISFYENNDFFGLGRLCGETFMINKQRKMLFYNNMRLYASFSQAISYEGGTGLYTSLTSSNKARLVQPCIRTEGVPMSQYLFSISKAEIAALGIDGAVSNHMRLLKDENNNVWGLLNTLLFK